MASSSGMKSAVKASLSGKRKREPKYECETNWTLRKHKERSEEKETTHGFADNLQEVKGRVESLELKSEASLIPVKETVEELDETPHFVEGVAERKKTLIIDNLSFLTKIADMINFFKDDGKVVCVRRFMDIKGKALAFGSVEFASANEAKKTQEKKNGKYLQDKRITLGLAEITPYPERPRFCREYNVWYKDYSTRECFSVEEGKIPPHFFEAIAAREQTIFIANLSPQSKISDIKRFFEDVGEVFGVRLVVNHEGKHVGYGFVDFADAYDAKKALEKKNGEYLNDHKIFLDGPKTASYSPRSKYSLAEKLWYEDYLIQKSLWMQKYETLDGRDENPNHVEAAALSKKMLFIDNLSCETKISDIINFFKDVAEVVHVRLIASENGRLEGYGYVEFASADETKKAQEKKNGECLHSNQITLGGAEIAPDPESCMYEDYLRGEGLLIAEEEEDEAAVEGLDDYMEEVSARKKTIFMSGLPSYVKTSMIVSFFQIVGEVSVRLIVDYEGQPVGCCFAKFASDFEARKALGISELRRKMFPGPIFLDVAEIAPYPLRPKYNLAEKLWYEDYLPQERLWIEEEKRKKTFCGKKITFSYGDD
ncbi:unnamed protein product [Cuscuta campestris]|uniref:RRM domain-containing protein n=1 Tax=Cuscuta campestris TaxID=132261 RepID=A0A484NIW8_9ASTE|nr:unnamed protein product [Cuscuta campestris]